MTGRRTGVRRPFYCRDRDEGGRSGRVEIHRTLDRGHLLQEAFVEGCTGETGPAEQGAARVGPVQMRVGEVRAGSLDLAQVGTAKIGVTCAGACQGGGQDPVSLQQEAFLH